MHAEGFGHRLMDVDWHAQVHRHSLGWVCAQDAGTLVGFYLRACGFSPTKAGLIALHG